MAITALLVIIGAYWWNYKQTWTLSGRDGRPVCRVQEGWTQAQVSAHCGNPSGRGTQAKVPAAASPLDTRMCSAPGDIYGTQVVLYGCNGRVEAVDHMPSPGFFITSE